MIGPLPSDIRNARMMERGSLELLYAITCVRAGKLYRTRRHLIWSSTDGNFPRNESSKSFASSLYLAEKYRQKQEDAIANLAPPRDPCPRCGTRMDIGCEHTK